MALFLSTKSVNYFCGVMKDAENIYEYSYQEFGSARAERKLKLNSEYFAAEDIEFPTENSLKLLFSIRYLHVPDLHKLQSTKACPFLCDVSDFLS